MNVRNVAELAPDARSALFERDAGVGAVREDVADIVDQVRQEGDVALRRFASEFDDVEVGNIDITDAAERAYDDIDDDVRAAIEDAAENIRAFHERQRPEDWREDFEGRELGRRFRPLESAGVYAPGGTAAYPSSALMGVIPAKVAGVEHVAVATPPADEVNPVTLAAIHAAGADAVYQVGGAQAIAALAYGTETVTATDIVVGPGNRWVTAAKAEVRGDVAIDFLAGRRKSWSSRTATQTPTSWPRTSSPRPNTTKTPLSWLSPTTKRWQRPSLARSRNRLPSANARPSSARHSKTTPRECFSHAR